MATRFFPRTTYAEDQPYGRLILTEHVIHRGAQVGALFGSLAGLARAAFSRSSPASAVLLRSTGAGVLVGGALLGVGGVSSRMWGREQIEWQDRSWRLLANRTQVEIDDWSAAGTAAGLVGAVARGGGKLGSGARALRIAGGAGLGNLVGVGAYVGWKLLTGRQKGAESGDHQ